MRLCLIWLLAVFSMAAEQIPRPAAPISFPAPGGNTIHLARLKGKLVVLEFLITTCDHCQRTAQVFQRLQSEFQGVTVIGAAINTDSAEVVEEFRNRFKLSFPVGMAEKMRNQVTDFLQLSAVSILQVPQTVFIDRKGIIRAQHLGEMTEDQARNEIKRLMLSKVRQGKQPTPSPK